MCIPRSNVGVVLLLVCISLPAETKQQQITVTGTLTRAVAIGGESTGWVIELESAIALDSHRVSSIEVAPPRTGELEKLENKRVQATGTLSHRKGVERGHHPVLEISAIRESKTASRTEDASKVALNLTGSEWRLEDLGSESVIDGSQATLTFPEAGKVAGNGSCNRFFGPAEIKGDVMKLGPLASTRRACPEAVMNQETKYLNALQDSERLEWKDPYLLIYCRGLDKPLRFTRISAATPSN